MQHCGTILLSLVRAVLHNIYKIYKRFYIFQGGFEVLKLQSLKLLCVLLLPGPYSEPTQISVMELFAKSR